MSMVHGRVLREKRASLQSFPSKCWLVFSPSFTATERKFGTTFIFLMLPLRMLQRSNEARTRSSILATGWKRLILRYSSAFAIYLANRLSLDTCPDAQGKSIRFVSTFPRHLTCSAGRLKCH